MKNNKSGSRKQVTTAIDHGEIHRRLEAATARAGRLWAPDPEETGRILKSRAQALAREPASPELAQRLEVVEFLLAHETYAIESRYVREVYPLENLTPMPCTPAFVLGIVNVRGEMLTVVDIRKFFDLPEQGLTDLNKVIVLQSGDMVFGILADAINGVRDIALDGIQSSLPTLTGVREEYLRGVTAGMVILDAEKLLADEKIVVQEQVAG
ncbi:chemotaxis protein CheW [mine drainage metagenome]|uniref:Chemotaxis protein CheW n=1 Tax=mine drainage metagenome TaxID=410659 RepID=A0A1J5QUR6_9ZZZZ